MPRRAPTTYIVFHTGYTGRLAARVGALRTELERREQCVEPLYAHDACSGRAVMSDELTLAELDDLHSAVCRVLGGPGRGTVAFKATGLVDIERLRDALDAVYYCQMFGIDDVRPANAFVRGRWVKLVVVTVDAESG